MWKKSGMCLLEAFNSYNYSRCIQSRIGGNMAFCWHCWQHDDSWGGDGTSKRRWRVGNIGAEQDEGITSPEIKGQASHTHTKNKTTASPRPPISLTCCPPTFKRSRFIFCLQRVWVRRDVCSLQVSACVCVSDACELALFHVADETSKRKKSEKRDWAGGACSQTPSLCLCIC